MFLFVPYELEVPMPRWPWANFVLIGTCVLMFIAQIFELLPETVIDAMILYSWDPRGLFGSMFLHADLFHLIGNMIFLWVFGNAVCSRCGNLVYLLLYIAAGLCASTTHLLIDGGPAVGASGAINGIIGAYLLFFPINRIYCFWLIFIRFGTVSISGYWLILAWFALDIFGSLGSADGIAYWAHIGGFLSGLVLGFLILQLKRIELSRYDNPHLLNYLIPGIYGKHHHPDEINDESDYLNTPVAVAKPSYYIYQNEEQYGPYEIPLIRQYLASGEISEDSFIFDPAYNQWRPLKEFFQ
ncbi:MAG: rhomboid family intramembrane serine protease [Verrucomicrobiota bacterium]